MTNTICGEPRSDGDPCQWNVDAKGPCPFHDDSKETPDNGREFTIAESDHDTILESARQGLSQSGCARAVGVDEKNLRRYLDAHEDFRRAFMRARKEGETKLVLGGLQNPEIDSSFAKFLLSTSFDYVETERREITGKDGEDLGIAPAFVDADE
jgi:hypothetical protein